MTEEKDDTGKSERSDASPEPDAGPEGYTGDAQQPDSSAAGSGDEAELDYDAEEMNQAVRGATLRERARRAFTFGKQLADEAQMSQEHTFHSGEEAGDELAAAAQGGAGNSSAQAVAEAKENYDKYLRAMAELENVKKRAQRERSDLLKYAGEHIVRDLLDVVDDLSRAAKQESTTDSETLLQGIRLILSRLESVLERHSIRAEEALGTAFDPSKHEALTTVPSRDHAPGIVMDEFRKAFFFKDKLIRPAQVVVSSAIAGESPADNTGEEN